MKTQACANPSTSTSSTRPSAGRGATRRPRGPRSASSRCAPRSTAGTRSASAPSPGTSTTCASSAARAYGSSRCRTGPSSISGSTSSRRTSQSCRSTSPPSARWWSATAAHHGRRRAPAAPSRRDAADAPRAVPDAGCYPLTGAVESDARACRRSSARRWPPAPRSGRAG